jgi:recombination protein RecR
MDAQSHLTQLSRSLARLPGVGRRSADRMAVALVRKPADADELIRALQAVRQNVHLCSFCASVTPLGVDLCTLCASPTRDDSLLCVVEDPADIAAIESSGSYNGRYHSLMGKLSPMSAQGPDQLRVLPLLQRVEAGAFREVILAISTDVEGDATCCYLREVLAPHPAKVSRLAFGLPAGSGIAYSDAVTLDRAMRGRQGL